MSKPHQVVDDELGRRKLALPRRADDAHPLLGHDCELVHHLFRANLLEDTDDQVGHDHDQEEQVSVLPREEDENGHGEVHAVEERKRVLRHNLRD